MKKAYHVTVLGAGPAGLASALSLRNQAIDSEVVFDIEIFDASTNSGVKVGETIPPAATRVLRDLIGEQTHQILLEHAVCPGSISVWGSEQPGNNDFIFNLEGQGYHLDRLRFEQQLSTLTQCSQIKLTRGVRLTNVSSSHQGFKLQLEDAHSGRTIDTDFLVDATGCAAISARKMGFARNSLDEVIFICALFDCDSILFEPDELPTYTLVESCRYGWWYSAKLPHNKVMVTLCSDKKEIAVQRLDQTYVWLDLLKKTRLIGTELERLLCRISSQQVRLFKRSASSSILSAVIAPNWLAAGDAACSYDPISSAGITKALMQGHLAGRCIFNYLRDNDTNSLSQYQNQVFADFNQYVGLRHSLYASEQRFLTSGYWQRRLGLV
ncbi:tryptophan 7-halogenase [Vibrio natriegens]|uniref:NAD(P)/FAD-dependent oxidoreductase n=1 Tax=Vibrio natriegens TaxID=691 RepID=UPI0021E72027|nr:tryptophan 7-halogenase [Vibrio natriegens]UYI49412.1 tryptophan 7-halogenase [Vibrio natriegens]